MKTNAALTVATGSRLSFQTRRVDGTKPRPGTRRLLTACPALVWAALLAVSCGAQAAPAKSTKPEPAATKAPAAAVKMEIPQSVFVIPASPKEGRNPFFPQSMAALPVQKPKDPVMDTSAIVLNGITSKPYPSVMINGVTFEKGEEHEIKLPSGGKLKVRCDEIRQDSALVLVNGMLQRELRLRTGL